VVVHHSAIRTRVHGSSVAQCPDAEAAATLQQLRLAKYQTVNGRIADAIQQGSALRYRIEHARDTARQNQEAWREFLRTFEENQAKHVEDWRGQTAMMLNEELPGLRLGDSLSAVEGARGVGPDGYQISRVINLVNTLRLYQRDLRSHVEQLVQ
jgi:flagellar motility protein MotE (MotC chaperone)